MPGVFLLHGDDMERVLPGPFLLGLECFSFPYAVLRLHVGSPLTILSVYTDTLIAPHVTVENAMILGVKITVARLFQERPYAQLPIGPLTIQATIAMKFAFRWSS